MFTEPFACVIKGNILHRCCVTLECSFMFSGLVIPNLAEETRSDEEEATIARGTLIVASSLDDARMSKVGWKTTRVTVSRWPLSSNFSGGRGTHSPGCRFSRVGPPVVTSCRASCNFNSRSITWRRREKIRRTSEDSNQSWEEIIHWPSSVVEWLMSISFPVGLCVLRCHWRSTTINALADRSPIDSYKICFLTKFFQWDRITSGRQIISNRLISTKKKKKASVMFEDEKSNPAYSSFFCFSERTMLSGDT